MRGMQQVVESFLLYHQSQQSYTWQNAIGACTHPSMLMERTMLQLASSTLLLAATAAVAAEPGPGPPHPPPPPFAGRPCAAGSPHASATFCNLSASALERATDLTKRLTVDEKAAVITINGGVHTLWASEEFGLHVTGYTECSHASGSPHGSSSKPSNAHRVTVFPAVMSTSASFSRWDTTFAPFLPHFSPLGGVFETPPDAVWPLSVCFLSAFFF